MFWKKEYAEIFCDIFARVSIKNIFLNYLKKLELFGKLDDFISL